MPETRLISVSGMSRFRGFHLGRVSGMSRCWGSFFGFWHVMLLVGWGHPQPLPNPFPNRIKNLLAIYAHGAMAFYKMGNSLTMKAQTHYIHSRNTSGRIRRTQHWPLPLHRLNTYCVSAVFHLDLLRYAASCGPKPSSISPQKNCPCKHGSL